MLWYQHSCGFVQTLAEFSLCRVLLAHKHLTVPTLSVFYWEKRQVSEQEDQPSAGDEVETENMIR